MKPVFLDFHIHTSDHPEKLNESYDVDTLASKIEAITQGADYLISLTDHNVVNKSAYVRAAERIKNLLLGVELHVRNYPSAPPYHCHILFNLEKIDGAVIDDVNHRLNKLYPAKVVKNDDPTIPKLDEIMNEFDQYEFVLLPHGGQNHSTFDKSIPVGVQFDRTLERSIYYNHFDGFTARSTHALDKTHEYFERLGIKEFVNLVTATDNYEPKVYPDCKAGRDASAFVPTWMLASPTFNGLRLSLSESSRLKYGKKPDSWAEFIQHLHLKNEYIDIDADLTPGLNVVIGGSSSGKSLLVDSIYRKIINNFDGSNYLSTQYAVQDIQVQSPSGQHPHYLDQNYIAKICDPKDKENNISDIAIIKRVFPSDAEERAQISNGLADLASQLSNLINAVKEIEKLQATLKTIPKLSRLIVTAVIQGNPLRPLLPEDKTVEAITYTKAVHDREIKYLDEIEKRLSNNPLIMHDKSLVVALKAEMALALNHSQLETRIREVIKQHEHEIDNAQQAANQEVTIKRQQFEQLLDAIRKYIKQNRIFEKSLEEIAKVKITISTKEITSMGHKLYIDNEFELTKEKFLEVVNSLLKSEFTIKTFEEIQPEALFQSRYRKRDPKIADYDDFEAKINAKFIALNKKKYRIITREGKDFDELSAGWKTSVILDLILGWEGDNAPLIIDQPEDNLATGYINDGLLKAIKSCKAKKQIILVSHNATIPMLGDAQNIVVCRNDKNKITIRSNPLEGAINNTGVVDLIARITDGGKASIKKRVKKYNLKNFRG